jgi:hypothetical protein
MTSLPFRETAVACMTLAVVRASPGAMFVNVREPMVMRPRPPPSVTPHSSVFCSSVPTACRKRLAYFPAVAE